MKKKKKKKKKKTTCTFSYGYARHAMCKSVFFFFSFIPQGNEKINNQFLSKMKLHTGICLTTNIQLVLESALVTEIA